MPEPRLPPEITDAIISAVDYKSSKHRDGYCTLLACCLVCHAWLPASRIKMFEYIYIRSHSDWRRYTLLVDTVLHSDTMCRFLTSIHTLDLNLWKPPSERGGVFGLQFLVEFAGRLPRLRNLTLVQSHLHENVTCPRWHLLFSQFPAVTSLTLESCRFSSFADVRRMLTALRALEELYISDFEAHVVPGSAGAEQQHTGLSSRAHWCALHTLHLDFNFECTVELDQLRCAKTLVEWITLSLEGSSLKNLRLTQSYGAPDSLQVAASRLLGSAYLSSVTDLTVGMYSRVDYHCSDLFTCCVLPDWYRPLQWSRAVHSS